MRFLITRTSSWDGAGQPADGAVRAPEHDTELNKAWVIELASLDDLVKLSKDEGHVIVSLDRNDQPTIEVYDDYRE